MKLDMEQFKAAFAVVDTAASGVDDCSNFVRLQQADDRLTMALTLIGRVCAEATISAPDGGRWTMYADRRLLKAFLATTNAKELEAYVKESKLTLRAGQRLEIAAHDTIDGYETWSPKNTLKLPEESGNALKMLVKYLPTIPGMDHVGAVLYDATWGMLASDTLVMSFIGIPCGTTFFLPSELAKIAIGITGDLAHDKTGTGIRVRNTGYVYSPTSTELDKFPVAQFKKLIADALKAKTILTISAKKLMDVLSVASQFLLDGGESALVEPTAKGLLVTVDMKSGKFQRPVSAVSVVSEMQAKQWPVRSLLPWLEYIAALKEGVAVEYVVIENASALRLREKPRSVLMFVDLA